MSKINLYKTNSSVEVALPKEFAGEVNSALLSQAIHVYRNHMHTSRAMVKTRGEVSKTTAKVYRQKGTGFARHGAKSAPIYVGGGKAHGPRGARRILSMPTRMRRMALLAALSAKVKLSEVCLTDFSGLSKTKDASALIANVRKGQEWKNGKTTVILSAKNIEARKVFSNLEKVNVVRYQDINAYNMFLGGKLIFDVENFEAKASEKKTKKETKSK